MAGAIAAVRKNGRLHVYRVDAVEGLLVGGRGAATGIDAGVVDQDVDAPAQDGRRLLGQRP
jgi:hypothetical protein